MQETQEMWVQSLGWEDPLEEEIEIHCSILASRIPWTEEPGGLQSTESQKSCDLSILASEWVRGTADKKKKKYSYK